MHSHHRRLYMTIHDNTRPFKTLLYHIGTYISLIDHTRQNTNTQDYTRPKKYFLKEDKTIQDHTYHKRPWKTRYDYKRPYNDLIDWSLWQILVYINKDINLRPFLICDLLICKNDQQGSKTGSGGAKGDRIYYKTYKDF